MSYLQIMRWPQHNGCFADWEVGIWVGMMPRHNSDPMPQLLRFQLRENLGYLVHDDSLNMFPFRLQALTAQQQDVVAEQLQNFLKAH